MINKLKRYWEVLIILILGLTPLLWYKTSNALALGHDMGFPVDPIMFFTDRLFLWSDRVGLGYDQTLVTAALLIHGLEALVASLGLGVFTTQKIVFIFWFVLPGLAMYYFVSTIHKERDQWPIRLSASLFYMFNHFLLQAWFIAERPKISLLVALPIVLGLTIGILEKRTQTFKGLVLIFLTFFIFNAGGGLPLYGGMLLALALAFIFFGSIRLKENFRVEGKKLVFVGVGLVVSFILANFYWISPMIVITFSSYKQNLLAIGGISGVISWSSEISKFASYLNLFRLQGIPDWYGNTLHPYANLFLTNPLLILVSFLIPVIVFSSLFIVKRYPKYFNYVIYSSLLALIGIIFTAGSHLPFGFIYDFLLGFVPGFAIFRTPFYKFAPALWFSYSYLFAFSTYFLIKELRKPKLLANIYIKNISFLLVAFLVVLYSFPFFTGSFFQWQKPLSTMVKLPSYILDFDKWVNKNISYDDRIITFPILNTDWHVSMYKWGYWSTAPLVSLITNKSVIANDRVMTSNELLLVNSFYNSIGKDTSVWKRISRLLGINYFLLQNDFDADTKQFGTVSPAFYKGKFNNLDGIVKKQSFGQWDLYKVTDNDPKKVYLSTNTSLLLTKQGLTDQLFDINDILYLPSLENENYYFTNSLEKKNIPQQDFQRTILIENCLYCDRKEKEFNLDVPSPQILPDSIFYGLIKNKEEKEERKTNGDLGKQIDFYLGLSLKRMGEVNQQIIVKQTDQAVAHSLDEIKKNLSKIANIIDKLNKTDKSIQIQILRVGNFLKAENRSLNDMAQRSSSGAVKQEISILKDYIVGIYKKNSSFEFIYPPDREKNYNLTVETPGNYEILLQRQELNQELSFQKITLDGQDVSAKPAIKNSYYFSLGKIFLTQGEHTLKAEIDETENLLKDVGNFSLMPNDSTCKTINVDKIYPNHKYVLSFNYSTQGGSGFSGPELSVGQFIDGKQILPSEVKLGASYVYQAFNTDIVALDKVNKLNISICHSPGYENDAQIEVNSLSLKPIIMPAVAAILDKKPQNSFPKYSVTRIDQTKYKVSVKSATSPYFLVLSTEFNSNWKVFFDNNSKLIPFNILRKSIPEGNHIIINGFANGWKIDKIGDYSLIVEYAPQEYFYIGLVVTGFALLLAISYLFFVKNYGKKS